MKADVDADAFADSAEESPETAIAMALEPEDLDVDANQRCPLIEVDSERTCWSEFYKSKCVLRNDRVEAHQK